jgi:hypothetical protein
MWDALASFDFGSSHADVSHDLQFLHQSFVFVDVQ